MFSLADEDAHRRILGCGDGPASFNAEGTALGYQITSVDPVYGFSGSDIERRFEEVVDTVMAQVRSTPTRWIWKQYSDPDVLLAVRRRALRLFLADFQAGLAAGRYIEALLPRLPFSDGHFDLAVCSHFLFLYSDILGLDFHLHAVRELCRAAREIRIFPVLTLAQNRSDFTVPVISECEALGKTASLERVDYEFQPGANEMLWIRS